MYKMYQAWEKGISTHDFRKCNVDDLVTIGKIQKALNDRNKQDQEELKREQEIKNAMSKLKNKSFGNTQW